MAVERVSPQQAHERMTQQAYRFIDVRTEAEFAAGHPAGAFNIPVVLPGLTGGMEPNEQFVAVVSAHFESSAKLIVGCKAGGRSARAAELLEQAGFSDLIDQRAGYDGSRDANGAIDEPGWKPNNLPIETGDGGTASYATLAAKAEGGQGT